ncbi:group 3 secretory phospholipase A2-like [Synchiropus splendidus]|uniref:group 3 secretory phospholipase A2-like n=1 Tax=Synchiropus splendidus TaxID=270530 RepID=UPI00237DE18B|nr:group 3 secretory phospholipase A2-like [Synchiropus splendidus]
MGLKLHRGHDVGPLCLRSSPTDAGQTLVTFLTEDIGSLFLSIWSRDRLVTCEVMTDPEVTENYRRFCAGSSDGDESRLPIIHRLLSADSPCTVGSAALTSSAGPRLRGRPRRKRAFTFPGTRWCGTGTNAADYEDLGMFDSADRCCRDHDHCRHNIPAFTMRYGVFNSNFYTVSHCGCDQRFQKCLLGVNDSIASMVGYGFFNILRVPCFELQQQRRCNTMSWWGMCKDVQEVAHAVFRSNEPFNGTVEDIGEEEPKVTEQPEVNTRTKSPKCKGRQTPRGDDFQKTQRKGCTEDTSEDQDGTEATTEATTKRSQNNRVTWTSGPRVTRQQTLTPPTTSDKPAAVTSQSSVGRGATWRTTSIPTTQTDAKQNRTQPVMSTADDLVNLTDIQRRCQTLRHLDECRYRIPPLEEKYHLQNTEMKTVYHCACTRRLAAEMEDMKQPSVLPSLLKEFVSPHCFKLAKKRKCNKRKSCAGGFVKAYDLLHALKKLEEKDRGGAGSSRKRRERGIPVRLSKRCLRLERENARMTALL